MGECVVTVVLNAMALCHGLHGLRECVRVKLTTMCGKKLFTQQKERSPALDLPERSRAMATYE